MNRMQLLKQWLDRSRILLSNWPQAWAQKFLVKVGLSAFRGDAFLRLRSGARYVVSNQGWGIDDLTAVWLDKVYGDPADLKAPNPVIVDVGAHIGAYAIYAALRSPTAHVYAFEFNHEVFQYLEKSVFANSLGSRVMCIQKGIAGSAGERQTYEDTHGGVSSSLFNRENRGLIKGAVVPCITLSEFFRTHTISRCDVLKMNCEGAEYEILSSLSDAEFAMIDSILLQWHRVDGHGPEELDALLTSRGYSVTSAPAPYKFLYAHRAH